MAQLPHLRFTGHFAWLFWAFLHIAMLIGFDNRLSVMLDWIWAYFTFGRGARLITGEHGNDAPSPPDTRHQAPPAA